MVFDKVILYCLAGVHIVAFLFAFMSEKRILAVQGDDFEVSPSSLSHRDYKFINNSLAYQILTQLDVYEPIPFSKKTFLNFNKIFYGLNPDIEYCDKHRAYFIEHPESIFKQMAVLSNRLNTSFVNAEAFSPVAKIVNPQANYKLPTYLKNAPAFDIDLSATCFFTTNRMYTHLHLGQQYSCLSQESSFIFDSVALAAKDYVPEAAAVYMKKYENRSHCLTQKYFPQTWKLSYKQQCEEFFKDFNSPDYLKLRKERRIVYIRKESGFHRGEGVQPVNEEDEAYIRKLYDNGNLCGKIRNNTIMQYYIHNPLLVHGHKFDFRIYLLVASTNPLIAYYHDGFLRVSLSSYDVNSNDKKVLLTNLALSDKIYDNVKKGLLYNGMDEESLKLAQQWSYERLQDTLLEENVITDTNWLDNYLRPEFKKCMIHLVRMSQSLFVARSSTYELFGVDFMLDEDLNIWFIEANSGPALDGYSKPMGKFIAKMLQDHLEIVHGLLRSRMKRALDYVNNIIKEKMYYEIQEGEVIIEDLDGRIREFNNITKNYYEAEFTPSPENGFVKIIDENDKGVKVYQGYISDECL